MTNFAHLTDRAILALTGEDTIGFLQSCTTNNIKNISNKSFIYTCILNNKGKFLADFFCTQHEDKILLDVPKNILLDIAKYFHKYALGQQVEFHDMTEDFNIWAFWHGDEKIALPDPRLPALGQRAILPKNAMPQGTQKTLNDYTQHRINCGVPDGVIDGANMKVYPVELGLDDLNGISYKKGCYVGQEVTARLHFKTQPKKRVFCISFEGKNHPHGTPIMYKNVIAGTLLTNINGKGLALLKIKHVDSGANLSVHGVKITEISLPNYLHLG